ncbi:acyl-ACP desaturase [Algiphilus sp. W345]|uniref:Acyl-ACP desaturase n=1 Tax=Banduia mediterranea TaxID=3075609 RepID=A0ABU2WJ16_9GAMM|nr:acyl-ACP desaturase [Algiphilus sp. W345]MDT0497855.1 acyl-ACP desaturase [Algiphilus sp. W345]
MAGTAPSAPFGTPDQTEVLVAMEPFVREQISLHLARRNLWFPSDLLTEGETDRRVGEQSLARVREDARGLPDAIRVGIALNLLTEEGLPHFHRLIATHLGNESPWSTWNNMWTAEEDRHGCALRDYVRDARIFDMRALERMQYDYIESGFNPMWEQDPYRLLAYTSLQEKATQVAHANTGRQCADYEPQIQRVLAHISGDESRHYAFYRACFAEILDRDPNRGLQSLLKVMPALAMPGHSMPGYDHMSDVVRRAGLYGPRHYQKICEELLDYWRVAELQDLNADGRSAQEKLMKVPKRLARMGDYLEAKAGRRTFSFDFIYSRILELE